MKSYAHLTELFLEGSQIGDAGLAHLQGHANLKRVHLLKTKVTANGIEALKKALPKCKIEWEGGVIDPK